jgi:hypothetical protein
VSGFELELTGTDDVPTLALELELLLSLGIGALEPIGPMGDLVSSTGESVVGTSVSGSVTGMASRSAVESELVIKPEFLKKSKKSSFALGSTIKTSPKMTNKANKNFTPKPMDAVVSSESLR